MKKVLVLGGAGFIGSQIAARFSNDYDVTIIDGLIDGTGGQVKNIKDIENLKFIDKCIEDVVELPSILSKQDIIIDSMGWSSHLGAIKEPRLDLELNLESHIHLLEILKHNYKKNCLVIYLGSTGQYGMPVSDSVNESSQMLPLDIQGINKASAENFFRVYSKLYEMDIVSLRVPNCYGENQPCFGKDIGLIGGFLRSALINKCIEVYGEERKRNLIYVKDLVDVILKITQKRNKSFQSYNVPCRNISIKEIANKISSIVDQCALSFKELPSEVKHFDVNNINIDFRKIENLIHNHQFCDFEKSLKSTFDYFRQTI